jgi:hypothetical protein
MLSKAQEVIDANENATPTQRESRAVIASNLPVLQEALRGWFAEIQRRDRAHAYQRFARDKVCPRDCIITFNYDVALDRELALANKFAVGDG